MSEIKKNNQNVSSDNTDSFDDEDDLWALQSDKEDTSLIDIDGFDDDNLQPLELPVSETKNKKTTSVTSKDNIKIETVTNSPETTSTKVNQSQSFSSNTAIKENVPQKNTEEENKTQQPDIVSAKETTATQPPVKPEQTQPQVNVIDYDSIDSISLTTPEEPQPIAQSDDDDSDDLISSLDEIESQLNNQQEDKQQQLNNQQEDNQQVDNLDKTIDSPSNSSTDNFTDIAEQTESKKQFIPAEKEVSDNLNLLVKNSLKELEEKRENLENTIAKLEKRKAKIEQEMTKNFAGVSQDLAIRVQGFKDYLVGSLQDLAAAAEQLELTQNNDDTWEQSNNNLNSPTPTQTESSSTPGFVEQNFSQEKKEIRRLLDQYRTRPDYYGPSWQLRRTFEPIHAKTVADWFFNQGGRGAVSSMGSRLQNILVGSAIISILSHLYGDRSRVLILADTPEKLGEWRRGLQDCLGISRSDFGPSRGVILFETTTALAKKGDQIVEQNDLPLVIMDLDDDRVSLSLLKFPLWLAFAPQDYFSQSQGYY